MRVVAKSVRHQRVNNTMSCSLHLNTEQKTSMRWSVLVKDWSHYELRRVATS